MPHSPETGGIPDVPYTSSREPTFSRRGMMFVTAGALAATLSGCEHPSHHEMHAEADAMSAAFKEEGFAVLPVYLTVSSPCTEWSITHRSGLNAGHLVRAENGGFLFTDARGGRHRCVDLEALRNVLVSIPVGETAHE